MGRHLANLSIDACHGATCVASSPECLLLSQVKLWGVVVSEDERKHRVLHQVIERPSSQLVQLSEILKVGDFSLPPTVR